ncbi:MAG: hypothetical protein ACRDRC_06780 [Pseudonocardiaceae bacterium]
MRREIGVPGIWRCWILEVPELRAVGQAGVGAYAAHIVEHIASDEMRLRERVACLPYHRPVPAALL